jgi:hypothetical protein
MVKNFTHGELPQSVGQSGNAEIKLCLKKKITT